MRLGKPLNRCRRTCCASSLLRLQIPQTIKPKKLRIDSRASICEIASLMIIPSFVMCRNVYFLFCVERLSFSLRKSRLLPSIRKIFLNKRPQPPFVFNSLCKHILWRSLSRPVCFAYTCQFISKRALENATLGAVVVLKNATLGAVAHTQKRDAGCGTRECFETPPLDRLWFAGGSPPLARVWRSVGDFEIALDAALESRWQQHYEGQHVGGRSLRLPPLRHADNSYLADRTRLHDGSRSLVPRPRRVPTRRTPVA